MLDTQTARFPGITADESTIEDLAKLPVMEFRGIVEAAEHGTCWSGAEAQHDNTVRASYAAVALVAYTNRRGSDILETDFSDLLADMRHLADALGINFREALTTSGVNYLAETGEAHE
jgi:hypothetical protein